MRIKIWQPRGRDFAVKLEADEPDDDFITIGYFANERDAQTAANILEDACYFFRHNAKVVKEKIRSSEEESWTKP